MVKTEVVSVGGTGCGAIRSWKLQKEDAVGRVQALEPGRMVLDQGSVAVSPGTLFIDCTASAVEPRPHAPIFQGDQIVLQMVRLPQPACSCRRASALAEPDPECHCSNTGSASIRIYNFNCW